MKTVTCDLCGETVGQYMRKEWSIFKRTVSGVSRIDFTPVTVMDSEIDLCDKCGMTMLEWIEQEIQTRPDDDDD